MKTTTDYNKQATDFLTKTGVKMTVKYKEYGILFEGDTASRHIFRIRLQRGKLSYSFDFGQSIAAGNTNPDAYSVLACLQKYDVGTFEDFCGDFGYDEDSRRAERIYKAVLKEYEGVCRIWDEKEREELAEIQ